MAVGGQQVQAFAQPVPGQRIEGLLRDVVAGAGQQAGDGALGVRRVGAGRRRGLPDRRADPLFPAAAAQIVWWCEEYEQVLDACVN